MLTTTFYKPEIHDIGEQAEFLINNVLGVFNDIAPKNEKKN